MVVGMLNAQIVGRWCGRQGKDWVAVEFHPEGRVAWTTLDRNRWPTQTAEYDYRLDSGQLTIRQEPPLVDAVTPVSLAEDGRLRFRFGNANVELVPEPAILGKWAGRFGDRPAGAEFHADGRMVLTILRHDYTIDTVVRSVYWVDGGILHMQQAPGAPVESSPVFSDRPGWLVLNVAGRGVRMGRSTS